MLTARMSQSASPPLVAVLNGPNMNMLGLRQPHLYGSATLDDVEQLCAETADQLGLAIDFRQEPLGDGSAPVDAAEFGLAARIRRDNRDWLFG